MPPSSFWSGGLSRAICAKGLTPLLPNPPHHHRVRQVDTLQSSGRRRSPVVAVTGLQTRLFEIAVDLAVVVDLVVVLAVVAAGLVPVLSVAAVISADASKSLFADLRPEYSDKMRFDNIVDKRYG
jgi:hypothetical protein